MDDAPVLLLTSWHLPRMRSMPRAFWSGARPRPAHALAAGLPARAPLGLAPLAAAHHLVAQPRRRRGVARLAVLRARPTSACAQSPAPRRASICASVPRGREGFSDAAVRRGGQPAHRPAAPRSPSTGYGSSGAARAPRVAAGSRSRSRAARSRASVSVRMSLHRGARPRALPAPAAARLRGARPRARLRRRWRGRRRRAGGRPACGRAASPSPSRA